MRNICLTLAYDGTDFHGWQRQPNRPTVQGCLEDAIQQIIQEPAALCGSGRTDAGVHALNQVATFKTSNPIPCPNLVKALNDLLPPTVRVKDARQVPERFHARYDVHAKTYRYRILQAPICSPFLWRFAYHYPYPLDLAGMARAARLLEGTHNFASFAAASELRENNCASDAAQSSARQHSKRATDSSRSTRHHGVSSKRSTASSKSSLNSGTDPGSSTTIRTIFSSRILRRRRAPILIYEVCGNGFLHHMVRNIVGTLIEVGRGRIGPREMGAILTACDRTKAGPTAPARGLCLVKVEYSFEGREDRPRRTFVTRTRTLGPKIRTTRG